jgi:hypothetical protein
MPHHGAGASLLVKRVEMELPFWGVFCFISAINQPLGHVRAALQSGRQQPLRKSRPRSGN